MAREIYPQITHIYWDCDGTLVDSESLAMPVAINVLIDAAEAQCGRTFDRAHYVQKYNGGHFHKMMTDFAEEHAELNLVFDRDELDAVKIQATLDALAHTVAVPHMQETLEALAPDYKMSIVTSSEFSRVFLSIEAAGVDVYFSPEQRYSAHDTLLEQFGKATYKPDPAIYLYAMEREEFGHDSAQGVAVEDSINGAKAAVAAGLPVIGYVGADHLPDKEEAAAKLLAVGADIIVTDMRDMPSALAYLQGAPMPQRTMGNVFLPETPSVKVAAPAPAVI